MSFRFRFESLQIWQLAAELSLPLFSCADDFEGRKLYRFAEQLRGAVLSITNNIAEGSGSSSDKEFRQFLNYARRSVFETDNILVMLGKQEVLESKVLDSFIQRLEELSSMITSFSRSLDS